MPAAILEGGDPQVVTNQWPLPLAETSLVILLEEDIGHQHAPNMATTSFTLVGNSADSPEPPLRP